MSLIKKFYYGNSSRRKEVGDLHEILRNLEYVLNTKKEFGHFLHDFGIGDYNAHRSRQKIVENIIRELTENIETYEPRVRLVEIKEIQAETAFKIRFELSCIILDHSQPFYIIFDSLAQEAYIEEKKELLEEA